MTNDPEVAQGSLAGKIFAGCVAGLCLFVFLGYEPTANHYLTGIQHVQVPDMFAVSVEEKRQILTRLQSENLEIERRTLHVVVGATVLQVILFLCPAVIAVLTMKTRRFPPPQLPVPWNIRVRTGRNAFKIGAFFAMASLGFAISLVFDIWLLSVAL